MVNTPYGVLFCKIGPFSNFRCQEKRINKRSHVAYRKTTIILLLQFAKNRKSISSMLRPQEEIKKKHSIKQKTKKTTLCTVPILNVSKRV